jgi:DNA polymerase-3 subunit delta
MLCGKEPYYIDKVADFIEHNVLDEMAREFDQTIIYGKDLTSGDVSPVIGAARGFAMMGGYKVIIVKEAQNIKKWDALAMYMENPQPSTILVFCYKYGSPDKRLNLFKNWEKKGGVLMESEPLRDYQVEKWIREYVAQRNEELKQKGDEVRIDDKVAKILADSLGTDLTKIVGALQKLVDGRPDGVKVIDVDLVERNVGISKDFNVFELQSALIAGDVVKANRITQYFAASKDHPMIKELGILYGFFANLMIYHYLPDKSDRVAGPAMGVSPFFVKDYSNAARRFSAGKTFAIIGYFREIDARLKGINNPSAKDADLWKELIYKILH